MLVHTLDAPKQPQRVVVIGAGGFVGAAIADRMSKAGVPTLRITRKDVDLLAPDASERLAALLADGDSVVAAAAIAPCKTPDMLRDNVILASSLVRAFAAVRLSHVVNVGSDAVFADSMQPLVESSARAPESYHGVMHLAREIMFETEVKAPLATLRPTLIYGAGDPHNGYGPNQFRRKANKGEPIVLFGEGEERRDHVAVADVAELAARVLLHRSTGTLNIATGTVTSFRDVATLAVELSRKGVKISGSPRKGPMPHNGYRAFDPSATHQAFPDFAYMSLPEGMRRAQAAEFANG
ncbi:MAG: NAD-dependent epimerase/dehydratase family protein [Hyphomicrobiales bacterium]|nr:MAG: NAD-dependent epimerase/dehydratase family protein [Hyphomicrobiales bacterium]